VLAIFDQGSLRAFEPGLQSALRGRAEP
jgi:hypothetical protein